ncbi:hypothetical protein HMPREF0591_0717 [Mycobacterium parascrofulaceum ATCC BAA-614]|uniref:Uncharacterized protein n=1 Tax=Mycobacterium parascrofulaceum ATCC BAA-614 TaxID=525368 RepID=D5P3H3_9MYCO|nr:hypothetical protein HMPREF0591_0717 [Mycobacterium parascrofulaceum ATCC BAA-614]
MIAVGCAATASGVRSRRRHAGRPRRQLTRKAMAAHSSVPPRKEIDE